MKWVSLIANVLVILSYSYRVHASELPQCNPISRSQVSYQSKIDSYKITYIEGEIARMEYLNLEVEEQSPKNIGFSADYLTKALILAKYSPNINCWKIQIPKYVNDEYVGLAECLEYSCNILEP